MNHHRIVVSLFDYTGIALEPWAKAGYTCFALDIQHEAPRTDWWGPSGGSISFCKWDANDWLNLPRELDLSRVCFIMSFPPCTDLAVSGATHFAKKRAANPHFQEIATGHAQIAALLSLACTGPRQPNWVAENPVSVLATSWRKPDHSFHPWMYGGYLGEHEAEHPTWPEYITPFDAYTKHTCLWTSRDFVMPEQKPVAQSLVNGGEKYSTAHRKLGGKSLKTKNIRSATPRGFAKALFLANAPHLQSLRIKEAA